jgi:flagellar hook-length control protein FliK
MIIAEEILRGRLQFTPEPAALPKAEDQTENSNNFLILLKQFSSDEPEASKAEQPQVAKAEPYKPVSEKNGHSSTETDSTSKHPEINYASLENPSAVKPEPKPVATPKEVKAYENNATKVSSKVVKEGGKTEAPTEKTQLVVPKSETKTVKTTPEHQTTVKEANQKELLDSKVADQPSKEVSRSDVPSKKEVVKKEGTEKVSSKEVWGSSSDTSSTKYISREAKPTENKEQPAVGFTKVDKPSTKNPKIEVTYEKPNSTKDTVDAKTDIAQPVKTVKEELSFTARPEPKKGSSKELTKPTSKQADRAAKSEAASSPETVVKQAVYATESKEDARRERNIQDKLEALKKEPTMVKLSSEDTKGASPEKFSQDGSSSRQDSFGEHLSAKFNKTLEAAQAERSSGASKQSMMSSFRELVQKAKVHIAQDGKNSAEIVLYPRELGKMTLNIQLLNDKLEGRILVDSESIKNILQSDSSQLKSELKTAGFTLDNLQIDVREELVQNGNHPENRKKDQKDNQPDMVKNAFDQDENLDDPDDETYTVTSRLDIKV